MDSANAISVPADVHTILKKNVSSDGQPGPIADVPYRQMIGSLMYLAVGSRPNIMFAVTHTGSPDATTKPMLGRPMAANCWPTICQPILGQHRQMTGRLTLQFS